MPEPGMGGSGGGFFSNPRNWLSLAGNAGPILEFAGGLLGRGASRRSARDANIWQALARDDSNYWNQVGHQFQQENRDHFLRQQALDNDFRLNTIRYRVEDATRAGIHPLYALGGSASFSPTTSSAMPGGAAVGGWSPMPGQSHSGSFAGDALKGLGAALRKFAVKQDASKTKYHEALADQAVTEAAIKRLEYNQMARELTATATPAPQLADERAKVEQPEGHKRGQFPFFVDVLRTDGSWGIQPNPDLELDLLGSMFGAWNTAVPLFKKAAGAVFGDKPKGKLRKPQ